MKVPELDFEIPPNTQKGVITTVEGLLSQSVNDLLKEQPQRKVTISFVSSCKRSEPVIFSVLHFIIDCG